MKTSPTWLQNYFEKKLPQPETLAETLTFHTVEVEEVTPSYIDLKILPDRAAYLLCHRGAALELSAALDIPMKEDPLRTSTQPFPETDALSISITTDACNRFMGALVKGVKVGPSPAWLREALESVGQRSINNVVDATNYVMLDIGQPLHAFDADRLKSDAGKYAIGVRGAMAGEAFTSLSGDDYMLPEGAVVITDRYTDAAIGLGGVKGGAAAAITESTTNLIVEAANFDGTTIRRTAQALKLFTDASSRFQNRPSPALTAYGMRDVLALILAIAGGELIGVADAYPHPQEILPVATSLAALNARLGSDFSREEVTSVFARLGFSYTESEDTFTVLPPFERRDILIPEDLSEEVGRILGYDRIPSIPLPSVPRDPEQSMYRGIERVRDFLTERGFVEISTPSFDVAGDIELANPLQADKPWLRSSLLPNMQNALERANVVAPRALGPVPLVKLFELGTVFPKGGETLAVAFGIEGKGAEEVLKENAATFEQELLQTPGAARFSLDARMVEAALSYELLTKLGEEYAPPRVELTAYQPFSIYPFILRDIAVWTPAGTSEEDLKEAIRTEAGDLLVRIDAFDRFEKDGRISYAFRLVFESPERTLTDEEIAPVMDRIAAMLNGQAGYQVR